MIKRSIAEGLYKRFHQGKAIILLGARQIGKSTLVEELLKQHGLDPVYLNGDEADVRELLSNPGSTRLKSILGKNKLIFIDEAQRIPEIGLTLKLITDQLKDVQVIATGSSALDINNKSAETLTGRKFEFTLFPISFDEMVGHHGLLEEKRQLERRLVYGYYPEVINYPEEAEERIKLLADSYLYKDILLLEQVKKPVLLEKLLRALALQVGSEVNYAELAQLVASDPKTVEKYLDLLEKAFVVFKLPALNRNVRNEIKKGKKIYFFDCGIRNAILNDFKPLHNRTDIGALWENFIISERYKFIHNRNEKKSFYFWRTTQQQEIDLIEEQGNEMTAFEIKWNPSAKMKFSTTFTDNYSVKELIRVHQKNFDEILRS
ncbi:ATP-binding protein [Flavihumibacter sp. UBA7668]|uniref:ATP-binding protein n=1 Tax=Flavihumibacter sp. UBA7668 TaxID=1946542 RepID=UPI0025C22BE9|nr:ATP-binding protein [Flavihumibacter sp. UBA7668]